AAPPASGRRRPWQAPQAARDTKPFATRDSVEPDAPRQPLGAGAEAGVPAGARVELADELEKPRGRRIEVRRELGDLVAQPLEFGSASNSGFGHRRDADVDIGIHRRVLRCSAPTLRPDFRASPAASRSTIATESEDFRYDPVHGF